MRVQKSNVCLSCLLIHLFLFLALAGCIKREASVNELQPVDTAAFDSCMQQILAPSPPNMRLNTHAWQWKADQEAYLAGLKLRTTPRGEAAAMDAEKTDDARMLKTASEWLSVAVTQETTPHLCRYITVGRKNIAKSIAATKIVNERKRPFVLHPEDPTCRRDLKQYSNPVHSYPSGHSGAYHGLALLLAAIHPQCAADVMQKAWEKGESRWICGYHWASDVEAGRIVATYAYAKLSGNAAFQALQRAAQTELEAVLRKRQRLSGNER